MNTSEHEILPEIVLIADPMCPESWAMDPVFQILFKKYDGLLDFRLLLGGLQPWIQAPYSEKERQKMGDHWARVSELSGQRFSFDALKRGRIFNTEQACRMIVLAREYEKGLEWKMLHRLQRAYFLEGQDLNRPDILFKIAEEFGLEKASTNKLFHNPELQNRTMADFQEAKELGVQKFPAILLEEHYVLEIVTQGFVEEKSLIKQLQYRVEPILE